MGRRDDHEWQEWMTEEMFRQKLAAILGRMSGEQILRIGTAREIFSEALYDRVLKELDNDRNPPALAEIRCSITDEERDVFEEISQREIAEKYNNHLMARVLKRERHLEWCFDCCWRD